MPGERADHQTGSGTFSPYDVSIKAGAVNGGQYSSLASALQNAASGQVVDAAPVNYTQNDNLNIYSGITLRLQPGFTLNMANGKKITVNGALAASGSDASRITFRAASGTWYGIEVNYGASFHPSFCNFDHVQTAIRYYHAYGDVHSCNFTDYSTALRYENSSSGRIDYSSLVAYGGTAIDCAQYSSPEGRSYNEIEDNFYGLKVDNTATPNLGVSAAGGYNSILNVVWDVYSTNASTIYALYNWWGSSSPDPSLYGNVSWNPYLNYNPLAKSAVVERPRSAIPDFAPADTVGVSEFNQALRLYFAEEYATALPLLQNLVSKYADYNIGRQALALEKQTLDRLARGQEVLSRMTAVAENHRDKEIAGLAQSFAVGYYLEHADYANARNTAEAILTSHAQSAVAKYALYDLATIYWYYLNDHKTGEAYYRELIAKYPEHALAVSALATLGEWQPDKQAKPDTPPAASTAAVPTAFTVTPNYPNPFNPETVIRYGLPEAGQVRLHIYNLLGKEVQMIAASHNAAGFYTLRWQGRDAAGVAVPSGIYFYRLSFSPTAANAETLVRSGKMSLLR